MGDRHTRLLSWATTPGRLAVQPCGATTRHAVLRDADMYAEAQLVVNFLRHQPRFGVAYTTGALPSVPPRSTSAAAGRQASHTAACRHAEPSGDTDERRPSIRGSESTSIFCRSYTDRAPEGSCSKDRWPPTLYSGLRSRRAAALRAMMTILGRAVRYAFSGRGGSTVLAPSSSTVQRAPKELPSRTSSSDRASTRVW